MWFVISAGGVLSKREFLDELRQNKICPLMVFSRDDKTFVPFFLDPYVGLEFARRNTPKTDCIGVVNLSEDEQKNLLNSGFELTQLDWPCKREVSVHVLFLEREIETIVSGFRKT